MNTEKCKVLLSALETGSLTATAEKLGYTTGGVSRTIASLEEETGFTLLLRDRSGVRPTKECELLLPTMRELVFQASQYELRAAAIRGVESGAVTVGVCYNACYRWLSRIFADFIHIYPGIKVESVDNVLSADMLIALREHRVDIALVSRRDDISNWLTLTVDPMVVVLPRSHPLANGKTFPLDALKTEPYIDIRPGTERDSSRTLQKYGITPNVSFSCSSPSTALAMISAGLGVTVLNKIATRNLPQDLVALPLDSGDEVEIGFAFLPPDQLSPAAKRFIAYLKDSLPFLTE